MQVEQNSTAGGIEVKICGITQVEALRAAITFGARYAGLVFYPPSPRALNIKQAAQLAAIADGAIHLVGLLVDPDNEQINQLTTQLPLQLLQLHGQESPSRVREIRRRWGLPIIKALRIATAQDLAHANDYQNSGADYLLFDAKPKGHHLPGGTGQSFDWRLLSTYQLEVPWFLSGGINSGNLHQAVIISGARKIDVSSGVEETLGTKSPLLIQEFLQRATSC